MWKILVLSLLSACLHSSPLTGPEVELASVAKLDIDYGFAQSWCTAWAVSPGTFATAGHCFQGDYPHRHVGVHEISNVRVSKDGDVALFDSTAPAKVAALGPLPRFGDRVHTIGWPGSPDMTPHLGVHEGLVGQTEGDLIKVSVIISPGISGGPLFNQDGEVVGLVVSGYKNHPMTYAEPVSKVKALLLTK